MIQYHFYANFKGRPVKARSTLRPEVVTQDWQEWAHIVDMLTGEAKTVLGPSLTPLSKVEVSELVATIKGDDGSKHRGEPGHP